MLHGVMAERRHNQNTAGGLYAVQAEQWHLVRQGAAAYVHFCK
jgi:hypothetical protein